MKQFIHTDSFKVVNPALAKLKRGTSAKENIEYNDKKLRRFKSLNQVQTLDQIANGHMASIAREIYTR